MLSLSRVRAPRAFRAAVHHAARRCRCLKCPIDYLWLLRCYNFFCCGTSQSGALTGVKPIGASSIAMPTEKELAADPKAAQRSFEKQLEMQLVKYNEYTFPDNQVEVAAITEADKRIIALEEQRVRTP